MEFEYYVLNYDWNSHKVIAYNIFNNHYVSEWTEKAVKKYIRCPKKFKYIKQYANAYLNKEEISVYGFDAFCLEIRSILMNQFWSRREYEISVSDAFIYEIRDIVNDLDKYESLVDLKEELIKISTRNPKLEKWDVFKQCEPNIKFIAYEIIRQYKEQIKNKGEQ